MNSILSAILCWLQDFFYSLNDLGLQAWDSLLSPADATLASLDVSALSAPIIPDAYGWVLGATGVAPALAIIATAMLTRFVLQTIPFVRWGS
jgi:hypothetical protein